MLDPVSSTQYPVGSKQRTLQYVASPLDHNRHRLQYRRDSSVHGSNQNSLSRQTLSLGLRTVPQIVAAVTASAYIVNHRSTSKRSTACTLTRSELPFHDSLSRFSNCNRRLHRSSVRPMAQSARISTQLNTDSRSPSIARIGLPAMSLTLLVSSLSLSLSALFSPFCPEPVWKKK
ncbi:hypothetical protein F2Q70_00015916 [Brassica cretica]|uniref:Uncharacterized protein n=1 Tax=Brassica cretica TaxID=69181 RepID=A0A8S9HUF6_BRACR|nr:hypothetical protein F2Q70_00015916 [Brassica cretica]